MVKPLNPKYPQNPDSKRHALSRVFRLPKGFFSRVVIVIVNCIRAVGV